LKCPLEEKDKERGGGTPIKNDLDDGMMEEGALDFWLESVNENEFDEKMDTYLSSEKLVHFKDIPDIVESAVSETQNQVNMPSMSQNQKDHKGYNLPIRHPYNPVEIILIGQRRITPNSIGHAQFIPPDDITRTYGNNLNTIAEASLSVTDKLSDITSLEESSTAGPTNENISIKRLYESLERKGLMKKTSRPETSYLSESGVSEWHEDNIFIQNDDFSLKNKVKKQIQKTKAEIEISPNPFKSRCSSAKELLVRIDPKPKINDANVVYAWDPQNQSISTKVKLEKLNNHLKITEPASPQKPASPRVHTSRIPLINNYLFRKMFGNGRYNNDKP
jgi:hypothetical protein